MDFLEEQTVRHCRNCKEPLASDAVYCPKCSQKYTDGRITIRALLYDFFESLLNFDAKIFRTIRDLFIPGKLTNEYFRGKHVSYVSPVRIFFAMAVVHFAVMGFLGNGIFNLNSTNGEQYEPYRNAYQAVFMEELDSAKQRVLQEFPKNPSVVSALDSLAKQMKDPRQDSVPMGYLHLKKDFSIDPQELHVSQGDLIVYETNPDTFFNSYNIHGTLNRLQVGQEAHFYLEGKSFSTFLISKLIWMVVLMMPALALVLKLLYIRRNRYFVEHLIFSFHYHAFAFFIISIAIILHVLGWFNTNPNDDNSPPLVVGTIIVLVYLFIAMRRVYKQGFWKTFFKFSILNFSYIIIFSLFFGLTLLVSFLIF